jgi:hypothetical protein
MKNNKRVWPTGGFGFYVDFEEAGTQRNEVKLIPANWFMKNNKRVWPTGGFGFYVDFEEAGTQRNEVKLIPA